MKPEIFPIFFVFWIALAVAGFFLFYANKNVRFKKKYFPWYVIFSSILFLSFTVKMGTPLETLFFIVPVLALITFLNIRATKFCDHCGRTIINQMWFTKAEYCAKCGARLDD